jgi:ADP-dependent NAD(P)H-hydrate dehydratase / NAD(P)H-hydrate epimerase
MKVLTGSQMAELDRQAIERLGIPSLVLMEMAGRAVTEELCTRFPDIAHKKIVVIIGKGNNGGDGLVVARSLIDLGAAVEVHALCAPKEFSEETRHQAELLNKLGITLKHHTKPHDMRALARALADAELVVDGLFGTGFRGAAQGLAAEAIELINLSSAFVCAIDIPSGVEADTGHVLGPAVYADLTVTFALPKLGLLLYPGTPVRRRAGRQAHRVSPHADRPVCQHDDACRRRLGARASAQARALQPQGRLW